MPGPGSRDSLLETGLVPPNGLGGTQVITKFAEVALRLCVPPVKKVATPG
jgi:hypothetical protein